VAPAENGVVVLPLAVIFGAVHHNTGVIKWNSRSTTPQQQQQPPPPPPVNPPHSHPVLHA